MENINVLVSMPKTQKRPEREWEVIKNLGLACHLFAKTVRKFG